ncbi:uncharacterized protein LOC135491570 isoform X2 [Lineus longissimus]|uniref:uncharacterized protein LOC135491570 isoform X2 n=1 Tax=Lineus longissimus TaxID=88925 RepID=UPI00315D59A9
MGCSALLLAVLLTSIQLYSVQGCSEPVNYVPWTAQRKTAFSKVVVLAKIKATFVDPKFDYGEGSRTYNAEAEVMCVFKGETARIPALLNVTEAGEVPGKCTSITLAPGNTYILYLFEDMPGKGVYIHNDFLPTIADDETMSAIGTYCGVKSEKVLGASSDVVCPLVSGPGECVPLPVEPKPPGPKEEKMRDGKQAKDDPAQIKDSKAPPNGASSLQTVASSLILLPIALLCYD